MLKFFRYIPLISWIIFTFGNCEDPPVAIKLVDDLTIEDVNHEGILPDDIENNESDFFEPRSDTPDYTGSQLWKIQYNSKILEPLEKEANAQIWNSDGRYFDAVIPSTGVNKAKAILSEASLSYTVSIRDLKRAIDNENPPKSEIEDLMNRNGVPMTWRAYHRINDIYNYIDFIAKNNPDIVSTQIIGYSSEKRPLKIVKISNNHRGNTAMWVDGGIHAREWISPAAVTYMIQDLIDEWHNKPDYIRNIDWYFLPVANPDGYEWTHNYDRLWRKNRARTSNQNCVGVDLNRNFEYKWGGKGVSKSPCSEIYGGSGPFSEPETKAIRDFLIGNRARFNGSVSFHSYGQYILYPWGYDNVVPPDHQELKRIGDEAAIVSINKVYIIWCNIFNNILL